MIRMFVVSLAIAVLASAGAGAAAAAQQKSGPRSASKPASTVVVNINSASASELEALPGIGAKTAARIIEYRQKNGRTRLSATTPNAHGPLPATATRDDER